MVYPIKLNDKGEFMSSKKIIIFFDTWIVFEPNIREQFRLAAVGGIS